MIKHLFLNAFLIIGFYEVLQKGMLLHPIKLVLDKILSRKFFCPQTVMGENRVLWITKPLYNCSTCMASIWGISYALVVGIDLHIIPIYILILAGLVTFLHSLMPSEK